MFIGNNFKTFKSVDVKRFCNTKEIVWKFNTKENGPRGGFGVNSKILLEESSLESVFILSGVVYRIDSQKMY